MVAAPDEAPPTKGWAPAPEPLPGVVVPVVVSEQSHRPMVATPDQGPGVVVLVVVSEQSHRPMVATPDQGPEVVALVVVLEQRFLDPLYRRHNTQMKTNSDS